MVYYYMYQPQSLKLIENNRVLCNMKFSIILLFKLKNKNTVTNIEDKTLLTKRNTKKCVMKQTLVRSRGVGVCFSDD